MITPTELVTGFVHLNSLPEIVMRLNQIIDDPGHSAADLGHLIELDPALSARLLRIVNSPLYALNRRVDSVSRAVAIVGEGDVRNLAIATSVASVFTNVKSKILDVDMFWRHSVYSAVVARLIAEQQHLGHRESYFLAGLLHDIGSLLIHNKLPEMAREALLRARHHQTSVHQAEHEVLGFDHAAVGAALLRHWRLPDNVITAVAHHHEPDECREFPQGAAIVHIANSLANQSHHGGNDNGEAADQKSLSGRLAGLSVESMTVISELADHQFDEALEFVMPEKQRKRA